MDIAAEIIFKYHKAVYLTKTTYRYEYEAYSPGVILRGEIIKPLFGKYYKTCDLLGFEGEATKHIKEKLVNWNSTDNYYSDLKKAR